MGSLRGAKHNWGDNWGDKLGGGTNWVVDLQVDLQTGLAFLMPDRYHYTSSKMVL